MDKKVWALGGPNPWTSDAKLLAKSICKYALYVIWYSIQVLKAN